MYLIIVCEDLTILNIDKNRYYFLTIRRIIFEQRKDSEKTSTWASHRGSDLVKDLMKWRRFYARTRNKHSTMPKEKEEKGSKGQGRKKENAPGNPAGTG